jgi:intracellular sulfur oxidation DsrE/DsrF family protein
MKVIKQPLILLAATLLAMSPLKARESNPTGEGDYATLVRKVPHIKASIKTAKQMKQSDAYTVEQFEVIICGKTVTKLTDREPINKLMQQGEELGMRFVACGMSINKFEMDRKSLAPGLDVVPNGISRMFILQEQGYATVEL